MHYRMHSGKQENLYCEQWNFRSVVKHLQLFDISQKRHATFCQHANWTSVRRAIKSGSEGSVLEYSAQPVAIDNNHRRINVDTNQLCYWKFIQFFEKCKSEVRD